MNPAAVAKMHALGTKHATLEAQQDMEGTLATLVPEPVYEFHPVGLQMRGGAAVRRYYEHLFSSFIPHTKGYELLDEWANETSVAQEYRIELDFDGTLEQYRVIGILFGDGEQLHGERVYANKACIRRMVGPLYDELEPIDGERG